MFLNKTRLYKRLGYYANHSQVKMILRGKQNQIVYLNWQSVWDFLQSMSWKHQRLDIFLDWRSDVWIHHQSGNHLETLNAVECWFHWSFGRTDGSDCVPLSANPFLIQVACFHLECVHCIVSEYWEIRLNIISWLLVPEKMCGVFSVRSKLAPLSVTSILSNLVNCLHRSVMYSHSFYV